MEKIFVAVFISVPSHPRFLFPEVIFQLLHNIFDHYCTIAKGVKILDF